MKRESNPPPPEGVKRPPAPPAPPSKRVSGHERVVSARGTTSDGAFFVKWKKFDDDNFPRFGEKVILKLRGVVQHETYELDQGDDGFGGGEYFWARDDLDERHAISDQDEWIPLAELEAH